MLLLMVQFGAILFKIMSKIYRKITCEYCSIQYFLNVLPKHMIKHHNITLQDYYDKFFKKENEGKCLNCFNNTKYINFTKGYLLYCSTKCSNSFSDKKLKYEKTMENKYGVINGFQSTEIKEKLKQTNLKNMALRIHLNQKI